MDLQTFEALMLSRDITRCMSLLDQECLIQNIAKALEEYIPGRHKVHSTFWRPNKKVLDNDGNIKIVAVARLSLPIQKKITMVAAAFLGSPVMQATTTQPVEADMLTLLQKIEDANFMEWRFKTIVKTTKAEKHCAELWFSTDVDQSYWEGYPIETDVKFSVQILANSHGDWMYPVFDNFGNMIAFGRRYYTRDIPPTGTAVHETLHFDVYMQDKIYLTKLVNNTWQYGQGVVTPATDGKEASRSIQYGNEIVTEDNPFGKIPVIYHSQPYTEWEDVQHLIERLEKKISNHADTNDYFDSPIVFTAGKVTGFSDKGEQGKLLEGQDGAEVKYLTWDNAPASMKMEIENLDRFIHEYTHTPNVSFENMKGLGIFSGIAIKMLFLDAHLKAYDSEEIFAPNVQRRYNLLKNAIALIEPKYKAALGLMIKPKFEYFLPKNQAEQVDILATLVEAKIQSQKTSVEQWAAICDGDPTEELERIKTEGGILVPQPVPAAPAPVPDIKIV